MNICFIIDNIFPSHGGVGKTTERFAQKLKEKGNNVVFISSKDALNKESYCLQSKMSVYRLRGIKIPFTGGIYYQIIPSKSQIQNILIKEKIDVVILVSYTLLGVKIKKYSEELNIPVTLWLHFQPENVTKHIHIDFGIFRKIISLWMRYISNKYTKVIVPSKFAKVILVNYGVKSRIEVISNGINLGVFNLRNIKNGQFRKKYNLENKKIFLFVGRMMPEKNIGMLIKSFSLINWKDKKNKDIRLVLIGGGDFIDKLKNLASNLKVNDKVVFTGKVDDKTLKNAYKDSDIFITPSLIELEGISVLEAMAFGKPILVSNSKSSAARFLVTDNGVKFDPNDILALKNKMISLIQDNKKIKNMGQKSLKNIKKYDINLSVRAMIGVLKSLIARNDITN